MTHTTKVYTEADILRAIIFATEAHALQTRASGVLYIIHPMDVYQLVWEASGLTGQNLIKACIIAILHDVLEDTDTTFEDIVAAFDEEIAIGVWALSKDPDMKDKLIDKSKTLQDSLDRIKQLPIWIAVAKIADRYSNLSDMNPKWDIAKITQYLIESDMIADQLGHASKPLRSMLRNKVTSIRKNLGIAA